MERTDPLDPELLRKATPRQVLATYELLLVELRRRSIVRTNDAPVGQYAEWLAQRVLGGVLAPNSVKSYDLTTGDGRNIQVKARVVRNPDKAGERQLSPFRSFDFDQALIVLFDKTYAVKRAALLPTEIVLAHSRGSSHVNGRILIARDALLELGTDLTREFTEAEDIG